MKMRQRKVKLFRHVPSWRVGSWTYTAMRTAGKSFAFNEVSKFDKRLMDQIGAYWRKLDLLRQMDKL
jgi:hypothetical protein